MCFCFTSSYQNIFLSGFDVILCFVFDIRIISFYSYFCPGKYVAGYMRITCELLVSYLRVTCELLVSYMRVTVQIEAKKHLILYVQRSV
jgi:hypothetical protein